MTAVFEIGPFRLDADASVLTREGIATPLGARAVAVLRTLVEHADAYVPKRRIIEAVWPDAVVEEGNLAVQIAAIRRVLALASGERWIETLPRRGYRFVGPVALIRDRGSQKSAGGYFSNLPAPVTSFVGRERELSDLRRLLRKSRLLTLTGPGGIGKTRLAVHLATESKDSYGDGVCFIDFAVVESRGDVANVAAQTLGVHQSAGTPLIEGLCAHLKRQRSLLLFDNCEHVIDDLARLAESILRSSPEITVVATSREPLRIAGEQLYRLSALSLPDPAADLEAIRKSDAVTLFVDRAQLQQSEFALTEALAPTVARICVRLDGIPFALELAAALVHMHSIEQIDMRLDDRFTLLTEGYRTARPRQQTLRATLDWSYEMLSDGERKVLRRLAIFVGGFTVRTAMEVSRDESIDEARVADFVRRLVARSLVVEGLAGEIPRYRLLETTRAYALHQLHESAEIASTQRQHARALCDQFANATNDYLRLSDADWRKRYVPEVDNVRVALDWSFGDRTACAVAIALAGGSGPLWITLSLYGEAIERLEAATTLIDSATAKSDAAQLLLWLGIASENAEPRRALAAVERALELYRSVGDQIAVGHASIRLARTLANTRQLERSRTALDEALPAIADCGLPKLGGLYYSTLGYLNLLRGDPTSARSNYEASLQRFREARNDRSILECVGNFANVCWAMGDLDAAEGAFSDAIAIARAPQSGFRGLLGFALANLAGVLAERGQIGAAVNAAREGLPLLVDMAIAWIIADHVALLAALTDRVETAARIAGYADASFAARQHVRESNEARSRARTHALLRERLHPAELDRLLSEGALMTDGEMCRIALAE